MITTEYRAIESEQFVPTSSESLADCEAPGTRNIDRSSQVSQAGPRPDDADRGCQTDQVEGIIGSSRALRTVLDLAIIVAPVSATVLIQGETGTGKELIGNIIHRNSARRTKPLVKVNCAAIPAGLLESELFGYERGAFTGATTRKIGRFEIAHQGSLFLDEIGDIPIELQPKLLRVLQEGEFDRLGGNHTLRVNVRLIGATHRNLVELVGNGEFRSDLYYRLNVFPITVPPLRERREDIEPLAMYFVHTFSRTMNKNVVEVSREAVEAMQAYSWPGNIRELRNFIERSVILSPGSVLRAPLRDLIQPPSVISGSTVTLKDREREHICRTLEWTGGVIAGPRGAAARLGMKRSTLYFRMKKLGICPPRDSNSLKLGAS